MHTNTIYVDVYLIFNFFMNLLALHICSRALKSGFQKKRLICAALAGAVYSTAELFFSAALLKIAARVLTAVVIILIAFGRRSKKSLCRIVIIYFICIALTGGTLYAISALFNTAPDSFAKICSFLLAAAAVFYSSWGFISRRVAEIIVTKSVNVSFRLEKKAFCSRALIDTGAAITEPGSGLQVILIKEHAAKDIIRILHKNETDLKDLELSSVAGKCCIKVFLPEVCSVKGMNCEQNDAFFVGIDPSPGTYNGYDALVPADYINQRG